MPTPRPALAPIPLVVNGRLHALRVRPEAPLLNVLRNDLALNGPKYGCGLGECGACSVLVDRIEARACVIPVGGVAGRSITTLEGLAALEPGPEPWPEPGLAKGGEARAAGGSDGRLHPVQQAFIDAQAAQCGYCLNGMIVATVALLERVPAPSEARIRAALGWNLCRCGAHLEILAAVRLAAVRLAAARLAGRHAPAAGSSGSSGSSA